MHTHEKSSTRAWLGEISIWCYLLKQLFFEFFTGVSLESGFLRDPQELASADLLAFALKDPGPSLFADRGFYAKANPAGGRHRFLL